MSEVPLCSTGFMSGGGPIFKGLGGLGSQDSQALSLRDTHSLGLALELRSWGFRSKV